MRPFAWAGLGFVMLALVAPLGGYDVLADWLGWLLVLVGVALLPRSFPYRDVLLYVGAVAFAVSAVIWVPAVAEALDDADASIAWALNLPHFGFAALLCHSIADAAEGDRRRVGWWRTLSTVAVIVIGLPVLVFGAGLDGLSDLAGLLVALLSLVLPISLLVHAGRPWAARLAG